MNEFIMLNSVIAEYDTVSKRTEDMYLENQQNMVSEQGCPNFYTRLYLVVLPAISLCRTLFNRYNQIKCSMKQ